MINTWLQHKSALFRRSLLALLLVLIAVASYLVYSGPIAQNPNYHNFADKNTRLGIPNLWNVISNLGFLLVGSLGFYALVKHRQTTRQQGLRTNYWVFFSGLILVGLGSSYYHWSPSNQSLLWDRLPISISFMAIFSLVLGEKLTTKIGQYSLMPLVFIGLYSVLYWYYTQLQGVGDLRLYGFVQFIPLLTIPILLISSKQQVNSNRYWWLLVIFYALGKVTEFLDLAIYQATGFISGHSIKHLFAAYASYWVLRHLTRTIKAHA